VLTCAVAGGAVSLSRGSGGLDFSRISGFKSIISHFEIGALALGSRKNL
jgi:hypothetical protein